MTWVFSIQCIGRVRSGAEAFVGQSYKKYLDEALIQNFPELEEYLMDPSMDLTMPIKMEEDAAGPGAGMSNGV